MPSRRTRDRVEVSLAKGRRGRRVGAGTIGEQRKANSKDQTTEYVRAQNRLFDL